jgi:predicted RNA-binding protein YlqC (UPF0109 family)
MFDNETKSTGQTEFSLQALVEYVARGLVTRPDDVQVTQSQKGDMIVYEVRVADEDKGRVIGKNGRTAKALRAIVGAAATKSEKKATVEIID